MEQKVSLRVEKRWFFLEAVDKERVHKKTKTQKDSPKKARMWEKTVLAGSRFQSRGWSEAKYE